MQIYLFRDLSGLFFDEGVGAPPNASVSESTAAPSTTTRQGEITGPMPSYPSQSVTDVPSASRVRP